MKFTLASCALLASASLTGLERIYLFRCRFADGCNRRLRALDIREQKRRENHAKILDGVAMIHQCQVSEGSAGKFKALLEEFYSDSPERLKASLFGLTLTVKKPASDTEQD